MMLLYRYSVSLETTIYEGRRADYVFFLLFCAVFLLASTAILPSVILGTGLLSSLLYLWSRKNPDLVLSFMFGLKFQGDLSAVGAVRHSKCCRAARRLIELIGIVIGHLWYFIADLYPLQSGRQILKTPAILYTWFPSPYAPQQAQNNNPNAPAAARHAWGQGHRLN
jgi:hypothetical protein